MHQGILAINRLYQFGIVGPVSQDEATRQLFTFEFGKLEPPSVNAVAGTK